MKQRDCNAKLCQIGNKTFYVRRESKTRRERIFQPIRVVCKTRTMTGVSLDFRKVYIKVDYTPVKGKYRSYADAQRYLSYYVPVNA